jgi:hypothetical protein
MKFNNIILSTHPLGKGEVVSSILTGSTITLPLVAGLTAGV